MAPKSGQPRRRDENRDLSELLLLLVCLTCRQHVLALALHFPCLALPCSVLLIAQPTHSLPTSATPSISSTASSLLRCDRLAWTSSACLPACRDSSSSPRVNRRWRLSPPQPGQPERAMAKLCKKKKIDCAWIAATNTTHNLVPYLQWAQLRRHRDPRSTRNTYRLR